MALKNYTTTIDSAKTIAEINQILGKHKAKAILTEFNENGEVSALSFKIDTANGEIGIKLPAKVEKVLKVLEMQKRKDTKIKATQEQAVKVAWRNIKDWIDVQMALIDIDMVEIEEVFFPYILNKNGQTLYSNFKEKSLLLED